MTEKNGRHEAAAPPIWYKGQRVIRSIVGGLIVFVPIANASLPLLAGAFDSPDVPAGVYLWVNAVVVGALAVLGVVTRIMAIPAVNDFLTKVGAGSVPAGSVIQITEEPGGRAVSVVKVDPRVID